jgi:hypothetical protein
MSTPYYSRPRGSFDFAPGDDASHALLIGRSGSRSETTLFELEADRAPLEVRRADGEPFGELDGVVRAAGRWFVATSVYRIPSPTTIVWQIESGIARELVRIPRAIDATQTSTMRTKLARRVDGRAIGLVVEGEQTAEHASNVRWVLPITLDKVAIGEPESLGYVDLAGRTLDACNGDDATAWELDVGMPVSLGLVRLPHGTGSLGSVLGRLRLTPTRSCVEALAGIYDGQSPERRAELLRPSASRTGGLRPGELNVMAVSMLTRFPLRCSVAK